MCAYGDNRGTNDLFLICRNTSAQKNVESQKNGIQRQIKMFQSVCVLICSKQRLGREKIGHTPNILCVVFDILSQKAGVGVFGSGLFGNVRRAGKKTEEKRPKQNFVCLCCSALQEMSVFGSCRFGWIVGVGEIE